MTIREQIPPFPFHSYVSYPLLPPLLFFNIDNFETHVFTSPFPSISLPLKGDYKIYILLNMYFVPCLNNKDHSVFFFFFVLFC